MKFSVAIPAYKAAYLKEAIESVLSQSFPDWELVIVDDSSPEDLESIVRRFGCDKRVRYYKNDSNVGAVDLVDNWNRCLTYCQGDYVICMGDDDRLSPLCLESLDRLIERLPDFGVYHCRVEIIDEKGRTKEILSERPEIESSLEMIHSRWAGRLQFIGDFCFNRSLLVSNGGFFKLPLGWGSDDITVYAAAKGDGKTIRDGIGNLNVPVFQYRSNPYTISSSSNYALKMAAMKDYFEWFKNDLYHRVSSTADEALFIERLNVLAGDFYSKQAKYYIRQDVHSDWRKSVYWVSRFRNTGLSLGDVLYQSIIGIIK